MLILELFSSDKTGYRSEKDDQSPLKLSDTRKTRLTLQHLNRLRQSNDIRKFETEKKLETVKKQYSTAAMPAGPM